MFAIYDSSYYGWTKKFESWWTLIGYIVNQHYENSIAHNGNDVYISHYPYYYYDKREPWEIHNEIYMRNIFVYEDDRIINLAEIRVGIKEYVEQPYHYKRTCGIFRYRYDPVPRTGYRRYRRYYRRTHNYRNSYLKVVDVLPDSRIREQLDRGSGVWDDDYPRCFQKSWKEQGKKRHQWEN